MAEADGDAVMAVDSPAAGPTASLQARVEELERSQLDAEQTAHDAASRIAYLEEQLAAHGQSQGDDAALRLEVERLQGELDQRDRSLEDGRGHSRKVEEVEREKRELLALVERLEGDKGELDGKLLPLASFISLNPLQPPCKPFATLTTAPSPLCVR
jgi:chromosome segregation ATPase